MFLYFSYKRVAFQSERVLSLNQLDGLALVRPSLDFVYCVYFGWERVLKGDFKCSNSVCKGNFLFLAHTRSC